MAITLGTRVLALLALDLSEETLTALRLPTDGSILEPARHALLALDATHPDSEDEWALAWRNALDEFPRAAGSQVAGRVDELARVMAPDASAMAFIWEILLIVAARPSARDSGSTENEARLDAVAAEIVPELVVPDRLYRPSSGKSASSGDIRGAIRHQLGADPDATLLALIRGALLWQWWPQLASVASDLPDGALLRWGRRLARAEGIPEDLVAVPTRTPLDSS